MARCSRESPCSTVGVMFLVTLLSAAETYFVSSLGTDAIAAASLVVPVILLMTVVSIGGIDGGVSSAIACARGREGVAEPTCNGAGNAARRQLALGGLAFGARCRTHGATASGGARHAPVAPGRRRRSKLWSHGHAVSPTRHSPSQWRSRAGVPCA